MLKNIKKFIAPLLIAATLTAVPTHSAKAGLILLETGVGLIVLVIGIIEHSMFLVILDGDHAPSQDQMETQLSKQFPMIQDHDVIKNLAEAIKKEAANTPSEKVTSQKGETKMVKNVRMKAETVRQILAPTGLTELNPAAVDQITQALQ